ncbi:undecaprenyl-diphosphate phosphatase [bacterium]|nr:undecaprenyl-diphosphate phosphatase [bacterium]
MQELGKSLLLGIIEGITEFLPISSTAHLLVANQLLHLNGEFWKFFVVFIQSGAILAALFLLFPRVKNNLLLLRKTLFAFLPTAIAGLFLHHLIKNFLFESTKTIAFALIVVGGVFVLVEVLLKKKIIVVDKDLSSLSWQEAFLVGLCQSLAVIPGVSRAGAVMVTMILLGFRRRQAAIFSFLLAIPTIFAAGIFDLFKTNSTIVFTHHHLSLLLTGFLSAFVVASLSIRWLLNYLQKNTLYLFAFYRIALGVMLLLLLRIKS